MSIARTINDSRKSLGLNSPSPKFLVDPVVCKSNSRSCNFGFETPGLSNLKFLPPYLPASSRTA